MTLSAAEGYISQTPLKVLLREGFTACRVKSSLHLYTLAALAITAGTTPPVPYRHGPDSI